MKYKAYWFTNDGTRNKDPYEGNNKELLIRQTREIAEGNRTERGTSTWRVEDADGRVEQPVVPGSTARDGEHMKKN